MRTRRFTGAGLLTLALTALWLACGVREGADDLPEIRRRGTLRVLTTRDADRPLPRGRSAALREEARVESLARSLGLGVEWVSADSLDELIPRLLDGEADLVAANLTATAERRRRVAFSAPVALAREQLIARRDDAIQRPADLVGRRVAVRRASSHWQSLEDLRRQHPGIEAERVPGHVATVRILEGVASGTWDVALVDGNLAAEVLSYRDDLRVAFELDRVSVISWALRPAAVELRRATDAFLARGQDAGRAALRTDDLPGIRERGVLRVLTRNNAANYYVWNGELMGFEYELAREFARRLDLRLEMVVTPSHADLLPWLQEGRGDVVAASLTATPERAAEHDVVFSRRTQRVDEVVVTRADDDAEIDSVEDLAGRRFLVRRNSHYVGTLESLRDDGIALEIELAPGELETEEIIERVAYGEADLTLADRHIVDIELTWRDDVRAAMAIGEPVDHGWAVRRDNPKLLAAIDDFFRREYRGTFYNVLANRYFREPRRIRVHAADRVQRAGRIWPWDDTVRHYAFAYGFDWRLIAAQMYQESGFDPKARSFAGASGLMQVMPRTAREMGIEDLDDPTSGIHAGVRYLAWMRDRYEDDLPADQRTWFALASYNVGHGHVQDARSLAAARGWDPDRWFGHVERAILLKRRRDVATRTRYGWCRCDEPVRYVRAVRKRYRAYVQEAAGLAPEDPTDDWIPPFLRRGGYRRPMP